MTLPYQIVVLVFTQKIKSLVMISSSFSKIPLKMSPKQVDASNSSTESYFSFKYSELGIELIYDYSNKVTSFPHISSFTPLPS